MPLLRVLSLGAGVQSTTLLLMAVRGELGPPPDCAIFADTQWEPAAVYRHLDWLEREVAPFPVLRVTKGSIKEQFARPGRFATLPIYVKNRDGSAGMARRQCTKEFKIEPLGRAVRRLMEERGIKRAPGAVEQWIGISLDEVVRMKDSRVRYITHRWPLIEHRMTRHDCSLWLERQGYPAPPKSACIGCPYRSDASWRAIKADPGEWEEAVALDWLLRRGGPRGTLDGEGYLHRSLVPLEMVDLSTAEERGQLNLFLNDCEGMCGV